MTDSIKPPGGPPSAPPPPDLSGAGEGRFRGTLEAARAPEASRATPQGALGALASELRSGSLTPEAAVARLLEQHLSSGPARALTPAARAELERMLRARLEEDPTLLTLTAELGRAR